jgi:hypothetical protein
VKRKTRRAVCFPNVDAEPSASPQSSQWRLAILTAKEQCLGLIQIVPTLCFIIHGIGAQTPEFSDPLQRGIHRKLEEVVRKKQKSGDKKWAGLNAEQLVDFHPIYYANIGGAEQKNLYRKIFPELFGTERWLKKALQHFFRFAFVRDLSINLIGDVFGYLGKFQEPIKRTVFEQFLKALEPKIKSAEPFSIVIVAHSLGSIVLHDLISSLVRYRFAGFESLTSRISVVTMCSPISLFSLVRDGLTPKNFRSWVNFIHPRDPVAFPMSKLFHNVTDLKVWYLSWSPLKLHSCYWKSGKVHRVIAETIVEHVEKKVIALASRQITAQDPPPEVFQECPGVSAKAGFSNYISDFSDLPFQELFATATSIDIVLVYGRTWIENNAQYIARALSNPETAIRVCTLSPDSPSIPGFCYHFESKSPEELKKRIEDSTSSWVKLARDGGRRGSLKLYRSANIITHSFYRFDETLYFVPRSLASDKVRSSPPILVYRKTSQPDDFFSWIMRDFERIISTEHDAKIFYDSSTAFF